MLCVQSNPRHSDSRIFRGSSGIVHWTHHSVDITVKTNNTKKHRKILKPKLSLSEY